MNVQFPVLGHSLRTSFASSSSSASTSSSSTFPSSAKDFAIEAVQQGWRCGLASPDEENWQKVNQLRRTTSSFPSSTTAFSYSLLSGMNIGSSKVVDVDYLAAAEQEWLSAQQLHMEEKNEEEGGVESYIKATTGATPSPPLKHFPLSTELLCVRTTDVENNVGPLCVPVRERAQVLMRQLKLVEASLTELASFVDNDARLGMMERVVNWITNTKYSVKSAYYNCLDGIINLHRQAHHGDSSSSSSSSFSDANSRHERDSFILKDFRSTPLQSEDLTIFPFGVGPRYRALKDINSRLLRTLESPSRPPLSDISFWLWSGSRGSAWPFISCMSSTFQPLTMASTTSWTYHNLISLSFDLAEAQRLLDQIEEVARMGAEVAEREADLLEA
jgi:hypothetical protein